MNKAELEESAKKFSSVSAIMAKVFVAAIATAVVAMIIGPICDSLSRRRYKRITELNSEEEMERRAARDVGSSMYGDSKAGSDRCNPFKFSLTRK